jgi:serine/threonine protein kinase
LDVIGKGAYGVVAGSVDQRDKSSVAVKKIEKAFEHSIYAKRTLRELKLLRLLKHENIINLKTLVLPNSRAVFDDIYCISELMHYDMK